MFRFWVWKWRLLVHSWRLPTWRGGMALPGPPWIRQCISRPRFWMTKHSYKWCSQGNVTQFQFLRPQSCPCNGWSESRQILYAGRMYQVLAFQWQTTLVGMVKWQFCVDWFRGVLAHALGSRDLFQFWEISDNISEMVQDRDIVAMED